MIAYFFGAVSRLTVLLCCLCAAASASASPGDLVILDVPPEVSSIGQPGNLDLLWGLSSGYHFEADKVASRLNAGVHAEVLLPQMGFLNVTVEGAIGQVGGRTDGGVSGYLKFPYVNPGVEYNFLDRSAYFKLTVMGAPRRGGILGIGDRIRVDYVPGRQLVQLGFIIQQPFETFRANRPRNRHVQMEAMPVPEPIAVTEDLYPRETVDGILSSMSWMDRLLLPRFGLYDEGSKRSRRKFQERIRGTKEHAAATGRLFVQEDSLYHAGLIAAFSATGGNRERGDLLAREAEAILLREVVLPLNRMFGRLKKPIDLSAYIASAASSFDAVLRSQDLTAAQTATSAEIMRRVLKQIQEVASAQRARWDDSRMLWLPMNYGLRPDQIDTQEELDAAVEAAADASFTDCNDVSYLFNDDFFYYYRNMLLETRHYQATVIHDFRNESKHGSDVVAWEIVVSGYLEAFIRAVADLDAGKREYLPQFFLFLDEHYYRANRESGVISFLERLYKFPSITLEDEDLNTRLHGQLQRLRDAVETSRALHRLGDEYIKSNLKIQVNITHQFHPTFKEDAFTRDHRKIAFRDIFEEDPSSGVAVFTGEGIGEHYLGPTWEDRSLVLRGPDLVKLKTQIRTLFLTQGYLPENVPYFLRSRAFPSDYESRCEALCASGWNARALMVMNQTGFLDKTASVTRMALYNLMPPGSVLLIPDSIWASDYWASMFLGSALRGLHVYAISPGRENAPSDAAPTMALVRETLSSMCLGGELLAPEIERAGGSIHVGLFTRNFDVCSARERIETFLAADPGDHLARGGIVLHPVIRRAFEAELEEIEQNPPASVHVTTFGEDRKTKLHQKTQFFATREGIQILNYPEWEGFLDEYLEFHRNRCLDDGIPPQGVRPDWLRKSTVNEVGLLERLDRGLEGKGGSGTAFFTTVGSQNQDRRGMLLDGEVLVALSGQESLVTLMDFVFYLTVADWIESSSDINLYFPREGGVLKTLTKWIRNLI